MKISIYGPMPDGSALAELLKHIPADAKETIIQAPPRRSLDHRPCQRPGWLEYTASVDNKIFIYLIQEGEGKPYAIKVC